MAQKEGAPAAPPSDAMLGYRPIPLVSTSVSIPRVLYDAIEEIRQRTGETRSAVIIRHCLGGMRRELEARVGGAPQS